MAMTTSRAQWTEQHAANLKRRRADLDRASTDRADALAEECRDRLIESVRAAAAAAAATRSDGPNGSGRLGILLSGGVDSSAVLQAARLGGVALHAAVTVSIGETEDDGISRDEAYATEAARCYNELVAVATDDDGNDATTPVMHHSVVRHTAASLVETHSRPTIATLAVWGYMETRNSLIMSAAFDECRRLGLTDVLTGDNADEILGGSYDWYFREEYADDDAKWRAKRDETADLPFATNTIAAAYNVALHQPFRDGRWFVGWARERTGRADCVDFRGRCLLQSQLGGPYDAGRNCGKLPLREAFCTVASWRVMDWIFEGSGAGGAGGRAPLVEHYEGLYSDAEFQEERISYSAE